MQSKSRRSFKEVDFYHTSPGVIFALLALLIITFANSFAPARYGMLVVIGIALVSLFFNKHTHWGHRGVNVTGLILIVYNSVAIIFHIPTNKSVYNGILAVVMISLFLTFIATAPKIEQLNAFVRLMSIIGGALFIFGLYLELSGSSFRWINKTGFLFAFLFFIFLDKKRRSSTKLIYFGLWLCLAYLADDRTYLVAGLVFVVAFLLWPVFSKYRTFGAITFLTFLASLILVPVAYVWLSQSRYRSMLDELSLEYTSGRFFSGRDVIWHNMLEEFSSINILIGGGHSVIPPGLFGINVSAHNTYISVLTRTGIIGLFLFLILFFMLLMTYRRYFNISYVRFSAAFTIALLFKQSSEFSLIGNNISGSIFSWLVMAFGIVYINAVNRKNISVNPKLGTTSNLKDFS